MSNKHRVISIDFGNKFEAIAEEVDSILTDSIFDYIETMTSQLAGMATECDHQFLSYLLSLASTEANIRKSHRQGRH